MILTQSDADYLFNLEKIPEDLNIIYTFPSSGERLEIPFTSKDKHEKFIFDVNRASIRVEKITYQNRVRKSIILRRLDLNSAAHHNPDVEIAPQSFLQPYVGLDIPCPHLHIYIEGFNHKWAVPAENFIEILDNNFDEILINFFSYCNVKQNPEIITTLFT